VSVTQPSIGQLQARPIDAGFLFANDKVKLELSASCHIIWVSMALITVLDDLFTYDGFFGERILPSDRGAWCCMEEATLLISFTDPASAILRGAGSQS
jgi:hypothetical protein